jgi:hypothetical protein
MGRRGEARERLMTTARVALASARLRAGRVAADADARGRRLTGDRARSRGDPGAEACDRVVAARRNTPAPGATADERSSVRKRAPRFRFSLFDSVTPARMALWALPSIRADTHTNA